MIRQSYSFEVITPCFCGGAKPDEQAEIRPASIRGQLRWWFRLLGGFRSLSEAGMALRQQENLIFGTTAGGEGSAGKLAVRVSVRPGLDLNASESHLVPETQRYLLFPLQHVHRMKSAVGQFTLDLHWSGENSRADDLAALVTVFGNLGSLGFRSRRAMGALALSGFPYPLGDALRHFKSWEETDTTKLPIRLFQLNAPRPLGSAPECITELARWLQSWRQHGQMNRFWDKRTNRWVLISTAQMAQHRGQAGFRYARRDHNEGLEVQGTGASKPDPESPVGVPGTTFRPALGLPIVQFFSSLGGVRPIPRHTATVKWEFNNTTDKGRFASPVLLRPHHAADDTWHALVIFVDAMQWPAGHKVFLNGTSRNVSLDLYEEMKKDTKRLLPFP